MRTGIIILIVTFLALLTLAVLMRAPVKKKPKPFEERISLRQREKIPYGYYAVRKILPTLFKEARVRSSLTQPAKWEFDPDSSGQVVFLPCLRFNASKEEMADIHRFVSNGNHVFIISRHFSFEAKRFFKFSMTDLMADIFSGEEALTAKLVPPLVKNEEVYKYQGKKFSAAIVNPNANEVFVLGRNEVGHANFVQMRAGRGTITVHLAPLLYSNYVLLQSNNIQYLERSFSAIPDGARLVEWNEYYFTRKDISEDKEPNWLGVLFRFPAFRWAFLTALGLLLLYALLEMRRRQRMIPVRKKPVNDSLDFVQTIGRLYYDRKDHKDLAMKMTGYFLEDVRSRYKLSTADLDNSFLESLQMKSGYPADKLAALIDTIHYVQTEPDISEETLYQYHKQLENFYQFS